MQSHPFLDEVKRTVRRLNCLPRPAQGIFNQAPLTVTQASGRCSSRNSFKES